MSVTSAFCHTRVSAMAVVVLIARLQATGGLYIYLLGAVLAPRLLLVLGHPYRHWFMIGQIETSLNLANRPPSSPVTAPTVFLRVGLAGLLGSGETQTPSAGIWGICTCSLYIKKLLTLG